jgi:hypothetical protein
MSKEFPYWQVLVLSRCSLTDEALKGIVNSRNFKENVRWADFSYNKLTEASVEAICAAKPKKLVYVNFVGNDAENPCETGGYDQGFLVMSSVSMSTFGAEMEKKYGYQPWLHTLTLFEDTPLPSKVVEYDS